MDANLLGVLQGRSGLVFWVSAAAIAAGASAVVVGLLVLGSRLKRARRRRREHGSLPATASPRPAPATAAAAAGLRAYRAQAGAQTPVTAGPADAEGQPEPVVDPGIEPGQGAGAQRLAPLLTRLRTAASRLEEVALATEPAEPEAGRETSLKRTVEGVEYLFRAGA